jgi:hypothetical protein
LKEEVSIDVHIICQRAKSLFSLLSNMFVYAARREEGRVRDALPKVSTVKSQVREREREKRSFTAVAYTLISSFG